MISFFTHAHDHELWFTYHLSSAKENVVQLHVVHFRSGVKSNYFLDGGRKLIQEYIACISDDDNQSLLTN